MQFKHSKFACISPLYVVTFITPKKGALNNGKLKANTVSATSEVDARSSAKRS